MKKSSYLMFSLGAPLLIILSIFALYNRQGKDRMQALPVFFVGTSLVVSSEVSRRRRRAMLLKELCNNSKPLE